MAIKLIVDATADIQEEFLAKHPEIIVVDTPIIVTSRTEQFQFDHLTPDDFEWLDQKYFRKGFRITTSSPPVMDDDYRYPEFVSTIAKRILDEGCSVLYLAMGSGMSSTYWHAKMCFEDMCDDLLIPRHQLQVVDTRCMSTGIAMLVEELYYHFDLSKMDDPAPLVEYVERNRGHIIHFFTWTNLDYIVKSGRVSTIKGLAAKFLRLVPIGSAVYSNDDERTLEVVSGINSPRNLYEFTKAVEYYARCHLITPRSPITVAYGNDPEAGEYITNILKEAFPRGNVIGDLRLSSAIQAHGGPTSLHINFHADSAPSWSEMTKEMERILVDVRKTY